ncbi:MAG: epoxyqueuosine reductase [Ruminococcaceae bacterium]|nr:epoxyqueuosine reductase [Oscillospiraceae bacterium]
MITSKQIKEAALRLGADIVGIGSIDRWKDAPPQMDPKMIMPRAKSIIAMGFRVFRGSLRGIEEGTYFSNYSAMGYGGLTYVYMPMTVINMCKIIEDAGYEAIPMGHQSDWRAIDNEGFLKEQFSRPVEPGKPYPDVMVHLRIAGYLCGLGEIGYSKMLLTPEFGPRVRVGIIITEMELEPDPIMEPGMLCNKCMACVRECPGNCIPKDKIVKVNLGGKEVEWGDIDTKKCGKYFCGAQEVEEGQTGEYLEDTDKYSPSAISPFYKRPRKLYRTGQAVCGAKGCTRACMISLEKRGVLKNKFEHPFRTKPLWSMDWSEEGIANDRPAEYIPPYSREVKDKKESDVD